MNNLFSVDSNDQSYDYLKCHKCHKCNKKIPIKFTFRKNSKGFRIKSRNRNNRVDTISLKGYNHTFHIKCWRKEVFV